MSGGPVKYGSWGTLAVLSGALLWYAALGGRGVWAQAGTGGETSGDADCPYFINFPQYAARGPAALQRFALADSEALFAREMSRQTEAISKNLAAIADRPSDLEADPPLSWIDSYIFSALQERGIAPANLSNDAEFLRRVTLDLTGRIPSEEEVGAFLGDRSSQKRARVVDRLLQSPQWVDRWAMWLGDLLQNNARSTQVTRYVEGRNAFHNWIKSSLEKNRPYNEFVRELLTASGDSFEKGETNFMVGGRMSMGPAQDTYDRQWVQTATAFLGLKNFDCLLCHNGTGHLDLTNLWGSQVTRSQAWGMAAFFSRTRMARSSSATGASYVVEDLTRGGYNLNTDSGNRPARRPSAGQSQTATPTYLFSGRRASPQENYRQVLAQEVTSDFQFARATVNYIWAHFFIVGIVDPPDAFDLARLDPNNPPPVPWSVQPSHPELLDELARFFIRNNYDLKTLMREICNSRAYQLSSRYEGEWSSAYTRLYARHLIRRLEAEEIHDAIVASSGVASPLRARGYEEPFSSAMQLPDTSEPGGAVGAFLDTFLRGNRDDNPRRWDGSAVQALAVMNDSFVVNRVANSSRTGLLSRLLVSGVDNSRLVEAIYLNVLSRHPTYEESVAGTQLLQSGNRQARAEDLLWALYNKVDFLFSY